MELDCDENINADALSYYCTVDYSYRQANTLHVKISKLKTSMTAFMTAISYHWTHWLAQQQIFHSSHLLYLSLHIKLMLIAYPKSLSTYILLLFLAAIGTSQPNCSNYYAETNLPEDCNIQNATCSFTSLSNASLISNNTSP